jgi:uncharacterized LabA/DUF88 family protein
MQGGRLHLGNKTFKDQQEKRTDVNIAINMVADALIDSPDIIVLISGDTDLIT